MGMPLDTFKYVVDNATYQIERFDNFKDTLASMGPGQPNQEVGDSLMLLFAAVSSAISDIIGPTYNESDEDEKPGVCLEFQPYDGMRPWPMGAFFHWDGRGYMVTRDCKRVPMPTQGYCPSSVMVIYKFGEVIPCEYAVRIYNDGKVAWRRGGWPPPLPNDGKD
ncbi:MAG: hypothetical protein OXE76_03940 [Alphaproteobacteria bacterium]|nr:hypothetical protein [Alphaproteobacteria bacterium]